MKKKIGEIFTITRDSAGSTGFAYYLVNLSDGLALIDSSSKALDSLYGGTVTQSFTFLCIKEGPASLQLAKFRLFDLSSILYEDIMPIEIEDPSISSNSIMPGGWTEFRKVDTADLVIFNEAFKGFTGVGYTPILVKTQIVNGTNYKFMARALGVYPGAIPYHVLIDIYKPISGEAIITNIERLDDSMLKEIR